MARIRTIKPEFWTNERVMECSVTARLLFIGLWNFADDLGRLHLSAKSIKAQVFPSDDIDSATILGMISELSRNGLVLIYAVEDREYLQITGWQHQRIDKPQAGKHPGPVEGYSKTIRGTFLPDRKGEERKGEDGIGKDSEADASGAEAPIDPRSDLFGRGLKTLATLTGKGPDACRSFVGKCLKAAGDDAVTVLGLIEDAERNRVIDASAWIAARLKATGPPAQRPMTEFQRGRNETKDILNDLGNFATGGSGRTTDSGVLSGDPGERPAGLRGGSGSNLVALPAAGGRAGG